MATFGQIRSMISDALRPIRQRLHNLVAKVNRLWQRFEEAVGRIATLERDLSNLRREFDEFKDDIEIGRMGHGESDDGDPDDEFINASDDQSDAVDHAQFPASGDDDDKSDGSN